jgi:hypothetical protein
MSPARSSSTYLANSSLRVAALAREPAARPQGLRGRESRFGRGCAWTKSEGALPCQRTHRLKSRADHDGPTAQPAAESEKKMARKGRRRRFREARDLKRSFDDGLFPERDRTLADIEEDANEAVDESWNEASDGASDSPGLPDQAC